jgi:proteasome alpha subunit
VFTHELKPLEVEILVAELGVNGEHRLYHISYDGTVVDQENWTVLGGEADAIASRLEQAFQPGWSLRDALRASVSVLAGPDRQLGSEDLEVGVLARSNGRRAFRRINDTELKDLLSA